MRKADIVAGVEYFARRGTYGSGYRVRVIEVAKQTKTGWTTWAREDFPKKEGWWAVCQNLAVDTGAPEEVRHTPWWGTVIASTSFCVPTRNIVCTWALHQERVAQRRAAREREAEVSAARTAANMVLTDRFAEHGISVRITSDVWSRKLSMSIAEAETLLSLLVASKEQTPPG